MKWCFGSCGRFLPLDAYGSNGSGGRRGTCRTCLRVRNRRRRRRRYHNYSRVRRQYAGYHRDWYQRHAERERAKQWQRDEARRRGRDHLDTHSGRV